MTTYTRHMRHADRSETGMNINRFKHLARKLLKMISVDAEGFCESKDWPYLWSGDSKRKSTS